MKKLTLAAALCALCAACEIAGPVEGVQRGVGPAELLVRMPPPRLAPAALLFQQPVAPADGSETRPFASLAQALRAAPAGALLRVEEGTWREPLVITRTVVLLGRGAGRTRIIPPEGAPAAIVVRGADHVQVYGVSIEGGKVGVQFYGGEGHRLENVELRGMSEAAVAGQGAGITLVSSAVSDVDLGRTGRGIELTGGSLEARRLVLLRAGRRAIVLANARGLLEDLDVRSSSLAALQATDGAQVHVMRGEFDGQGGAALYAGAAKLWVEGAHVRHDEYAVLGARGAELSVTGGELTDYRVAGVAMVNAHGSVQRNLIARGGADGAIIVTRADGDAPVLLVDNRIQDPGTMGVHVTESSVTARGNSVTGARPDREKDMGDAFYAVDSTLVVEQNVMRGNAGSGVSTIRSQVKLDRNGFIENGRAGVLLLDRSHGTATRNLFERNAVAGVLLGEQSRATLRSNHFAGNVGLDIDTGCGRGLAGVADLGAGNTFAAPVRKRACIE